MVGTLERNQDGTLKNQISEFNPSEEVKIMTLKVREDFILGQNNSERTYKEFDEKSVEQIDDEVKQAFNNLTPKKSEDPSKSWRSTAVRPITRNKLISIAAHLTSSTIVPKVFAQNENDMEDEDSAMVMKDLVDFVIENSNYDMTMLASTIQALISPATIVEVVYNEVFQKIKSLQKDGTIKESKIIDEIYSGIQFAIINIKSLLIANPYENNIQKQRFLIKRNYFDIHDIRARYRNHPNLDFVKPGVKLFLADDGSFYEVYDEENPTLVEEIIYFNRTEDLQIPFANGIYMGKADNPEHSLMRHRDYMGRAKYPFAHSGFELISEGNFFYFMSAGAKLLPEQKVVNIMWRMALDGSMLQILPPLIITGQNAVNADIMIPRSTHRFSKNIEVNPLNITNPSEGYRGLNVLEQSMTESSQDSRAAGIASGPSKTAFETSRLEQNARIQFGLFAKMRASIIRQLGDLIVDNILNHYTIGEVQEITSDKKFLKFRQFLVRNRVDKGKSITRKIEFTDKFFNNVKDNDIDNYSTKVLKDEGELDSKMRIARVNPSKFRRRKFLMVIEADELLPRNEAFERAMKFELYDRAVVNPLVSQNPNNLEAVTRKLLFEAHPVGRDNVDLFLGGTDNPIEAIVQGLVQNRNPRTDNDLTSSIIKSNATTGLITR